MELRFFKRKMQVKREANCIYKLLLQANSFKSFCINNEVFDICKHKVITKADQLFQFYAMATTLKALFLY